MKVPAIFNNLTPDEIEYDVMFCLDCCLKQLSGTSRLEEGWNGLPTSSGGKYPVYIKPYSEFLTGDTIGPRQ